MNSLKSLICMVILSAFVACSGGGSGESTVTYVNNTPIVDTGTTVTFQGTIEKGALQRGSRVIASEWDVLTGYSGLCFKTYTTDDKGSYTIKSSKIKDMIDVEAEGYFFNENDASTNNKIILYGLLDSNKATWNINILTHIIRYRVIKLLEDDVDFDDAVTSAVTSLYNNLGWGVVDPSLINTVDNPQLLFLSSAICKNRTASEVSKLLTDLSLDLEDGNIDISMLDSSFALVNTATVTSNIIAKYGSCPNLANVKSQVLAQRGLVDITIKIFTASPIPYSGVDWYIRNASSIMYMKDNKLDSLASLQVSMSHLGVTTNNISNNILEFFSITVDGVKTLYFSLGFESNNIIKHYKQVNGIVTEISSLPTKPVPVIQTLNNGFYNYSNPNLLDSNSHSWNIGTLYGYKICEDFIEGTLHRGKTIFVEQGAAGIKILGSYYDYTADGGFLYGTSNARFW